MISGTSSCTTYTEENPLPKRSAIKSTSRRTFYFVIVRPRYNYTTYDVRRAQDSISMRTEHADIMVASNDPDDDHPFWYGRVLGIFHVLVQDLRHPREPEKRVDFLRVRWFSRDRSVGAGFKKRRLPRISFPIPNDTNFKHFGFFHPFWVIRASHVVPAFRFGRTKDLLPVEKSLARHRDGDWRYFYVNWYVAYVLELQSTYLGLLAASLTETCR